ncbi:hypothetical protein N0V94_003558 [Neodidymelliopsis sp. IMI 364377]|nr:hypothetical protein N0V94_003558 [Neodidymelliopsis sp. IMI 364377]
MVTYLRKLGKEKIVLLGSSTGCQDCMKYMRATKDSIPGVDGYILQAPTSDRETAGMLMSPDFYKTTLEFAKDQIARGNKDGIMPKDLIPDVFHSPITTYRWHSLIAKGGDDDYFSSDFDDDTLAELFGCMERSTMISVSEADEMVPETVDQQTLFERWLQASPTGLVSQLSGLIPGADHTLSSAEAQQWFADRVVQFLDTVSKK